MSVWWEALSILERAMLFFAVPSTFFILFQAVLLVFGVIKNSKDIDMDLDGDGIVDKEEVATEIGFRLFTVKNIFAFFSVFGWCGFILLKKGFGLVLTFLYSIAAGFLVMLLIAFIIMIVLKHRAKL